MPYYARGLFLIDRNSGARQVLGATSIWLTGGLQKWELKGVAEAV